MTAYLGNFVTIRKNRGDVLKPETYRTVIQTIAGMLNKIDFVHFAPVCQKFFDHLVDFDDPHHDYNDNFNSDLAAETYAIYSAMTATPLSLSDFTTTVANNLSLFELIRRIMLNRILYNQVKLRDGSVPKIANAVLSDSWWPGLTTSSVKLNFGRVATDWLDFCRLGWNSTVTPYPVVQNATVLRRTTTPLNLTFSTNSSAGDYGGATNTVPVVFPTGLSVNNLTLSVHVSVVSAINQAIASISSDVDRVVVSLYTDNTFAVIVNGARVLRSAQPSDNGSAEVTVTASGAISLKTLYQGQSIVTTTSVMFNNTTAFSSGRLYLDYENLTNPTGGLRSLAIYEGIPLSS